jgi:hypothetical protein
VSRPDNIEFAGGITVEAINASRRGILSRAPAWWRQLAERGRPAAADPRGPAAPKRAAPAKAAPVVGWLAGVCCPGVSKPVLGHADGETLPEQFTPRAWDSMLAQVRACKIDVPLTLGHGGPVLAATRGLDLVFTMDRTMGLEFTARLRDTAACRKLLAEIGPLGWGVSIGFTRGKQWTVERDGIGRVRVIDDAVLDHVAVVPAGTNRRAAYPAARCHAMRSTAVACPGSICTDSHAWAFRILRLQAGA